MAVTNQPNKKAGQPTPNKKAGQPTPNKKAGQPTPNEKSGQPTPNKKSGQPTPNKKSNTPSTKKSESSKKQRVKQVLAAPSMGSQDGNDGWPKITKKQEAEVSKLLEQLIGSILMKREILKPKWNVLSKVPSADRSQEIQKHRLKCLEEMDEAKKVEFLEGEKRKEFNMKNVIWLGYNQIMRRLKKGEVALVFVNKSATPDFLPRTLLPVCHINRVPLIAIDNLDEKIKQKCIAIGFKNLIKCSDVDLNPLYVKTVEVLNSEVDANHCLEDATISNSVAQGNDEKSKTSIATQSDISSTSPAKVPLVKSSSPSLGSSSLATNSGEIPPPPPKYPPPPVVDASRFHLRRTRSDQRAFVPNVGLNVAASLQDAEFIVLPKDLLLEQGDGEVASGSSSNAKAAAGFSFRTPKPGSGARGAHSWKGPDREKKKVVKEVEPEAVVITNTPSPAVSSQSSDLLFQLDFDGVDDSPKLEVGTEIQQQQVEGGAAGTTASDEESVDEDFNPPTKGKQLKRKHTLSSATYVPAAVKRVVGKMNKKKKLS